jgi:FlaG/FlaF family flagellin (archaellin)
MGKNDEGVSPVVGVMLMLSVTIIIAAIVSAAAGSFSGTNNKAPTATLDVHFYENRSYGSFSVPAMTIEHISGSPLQTKDLSITTYFTNSSGQIVKGGLIGQEAVSGNNSWSNSNFPPNMYCGVLFINDNNRFVGSPLQPSPGGFASWFGNTSAVLMPGDVLVTPAQFCGPSGSYNPGLNYLLSDGADTLDLPTGYQAGAVITVKIVHTPSGQVIFDKDVVVE